MKTENRFELKFSMSSNGLSEFKAKYNLTNNFYPSRTITSYYFDTLSLKYFYKSINTDINIPKYRIRYYNNDKKFTEEVKVHTELGRRKYSRQIDDTAMPTKLSLIMKFCIQFQLCHMLEIIFFTKIPELRLTIQ